MPRHENAQLHNIHFITCSNQVAVLDMAGPVVDAYLKKDVLLLAPTMAILSDNPRHSELLNHAGGSANKYCRMCMVSSFVNIQSVATHSSVIWLLLIRLTGMSTLLISLKKGPRRMPNCKCRGSPVVLRRHRDHNS